MFRNNNIKTHFAVFMAFAFTSGMNCFCIAQEAKIPAIDTPSQRWLPAPRAFPTQQENQVKLLSRLRDALLQGNESKDSNPSRLSDTDVQSLKEAMKQFENYFPEGLTADSLDAIPPELISKALSNPDLMKQAKEIAEKHANGNRPKKDNENQSSNKNETNKNETSEKLADEHGIAAPDNKATQRDSKRNDFADLMNKLRSTQQNYEQNQNQAENARDSNQETSPKERSGNPAALPQDLDKPFSPTNDFQSPSSPRPESKSQRQPEPSSQPQEPFANPNLKRPGMSSANKRPSSSSERRSNEPIQTTNPTSPRPSESSLPSAQRSEPSSGRRRSENAQSSTSGTGSASASNTSQSILENEIRKQTNDAREATKISDSRADTKMGSSLDVRSELDRRGFGPTMQKIVEEAQRASKAARPRTSLGKQPEASKGDDTKIAEAGSNESDKNVKITAPAKPQVTSPSRLTEPSPRNPRPESSVSKSMQKTGEYLNKLWTDATKNSTASVKPAPPRSSTSGNATSTPIARPEFLSIPNPFNTQFLQFVLVLAVACVVAFFVLQMKSKRVQERKEALAARMCPRSMKSKRVTT